MPSVPRPGRKALYVELDERMDGALRARCARTGRKVAAEVREAIRRHLAYPPPDPPPAPLPDGPKKNSRRRLDIA